MAAQGKKALVGLSGGLDSAMAALQLLEEGFDVEAVTMDTWDASIAERRGCGGGFCAGDGAECGKGCYGPQSAASVAAAAEVARRLGIRHLGVRLGEAFAEHVLDYVAAEYAAGRTPNPCARCNRVVKFGAMVAAARAAGAEFDVFATGHYARLEGDAAGRVALRAGADAAKDQSYFLSMVAQDDLRNVRFPLGGRTKADVREMARRAGWTELAERAESQDFVGGASGYGAVLPGGWGRPGEIVDAAGRVLGRHEGLARYTIGQRKGLGLGGGCGAAVYVTAIDAERNRVVVGPKDDLLGRELVAQGVNWGALAALPTEGLRCLCRIRQQHRAAPALARPAGENALSVTFDDPQLAITPGQVAALYDSDGRVLAAGWIAGR